jgi:hypothetical protein
MTSKPPDSPSGETPVPYYRDAVSNSNNPTVVVADTVGVMVLGLVSIALTFALLRVLARNHELVSGNRR